MATDSLAKARALLKTLPEETRNEVLSRMGESQRAMLLAEDDAAAGTHSVLTESERQAQQRQFARQMMLSMQNRAVAEAEALATPEAEADAAASAAIGVVPPRVRRDPVDRLRDVHPAALAAALRGERPQAWALVLPKVSAQTRQMLLSYLDPAARAAIADAQRRQETLPERLRQTAERAIVHTVVPRALQEHRRLMTTPLTVNGQHTPH